MWLSGLLLIPMVLAAETIRGNYILNIDENHILQAVVPSGKPSENLDLSSLELRDLADDVFINVTEITSLNLADNPIRGYEKSTFSDLTNLEHLSLAKNRMMDFRKGMFESLGKLKTLNISHNHIYAFFENGIFQGLPKTCDILLNDTLVSSISANAFNADINAEIPKNPDHCHRGSVSFPGSRDPGTKVLNRSQNFQICIENGLVTRVDVMKDKNPDSNCFELYLNYEERILNLDNFEISEFANGWYRLQDFPFRGISINDNKIENLKQNLLNDLPEGIRFVNLAGNKIRRLARGIIKNDHIKTLNIERNGLTEIEVGSFANMKKLELIFLMNNELSNIDFVASLPSQMEWIMMSHNKISKIPVDSFSRMNRLIILHLDNNQIEELDSQTLKGLVSLERLELGNNNIQTIAPGTFEDLAVLKELSLAKNKLRHLTKETFRGLTSNLTSLSLKSNEIESVEAGTFVNGPVWELNLSSNKISKIENEAFDLSCVRVLTLRGNRITRFQKGIIKNLDNVQNFDLADNPITRFDNGVFARLPKFSTVRLHEREMEVMQAGLFEDE